MIRKRHNRLFFLIAGLVALILTAACGSAPPPDPDKEPSPPATTAAVTRPVEPGSTTHPDRGLPGSPSERLTVAVAGPDNWNLNPFASGERLFPVDPYGYYQPLYQTLIQYDPAKLAYVPVLAEAVSYEAGILSISIPPGLQWHDGHPITSADLLFSIQANQKFGTAAGTSLLEFAGEMNRTGEHSLEIHAKPESGNPGLRCMEALSHLLILPEHHWETLVSTTGTEDELAAQKLPMTGSGPWVLWREDEFALSFARSSESPAEPGQPAYLSIMKYSRSFLVREAFSRGDFDLMLGAIPPGLPGEGAESLVIQAGERLAGITVNPSGNGLLYNRSFRRLLSLASGQPEAVIVPSTGSQLNGAYLAYLLQADDETISRLASGAGLSREQGGFLMKDGEALPPVSLTYPEELPQAEEQCRAFAASAGELGLPVSLKGVSTEAWKQAYDQGDYALIYTESCLDESIISLVTRLGKIPGLASDREYGINMEFDGETGYEIMVSMERAQLTGDLKTAAGQLLGWLIREGVYLPLTTEKVTGGLLNQSEAGVIDLSSIFAVKTQTLPGELQP